MQTTGGHASWLNGIVERSHQTTTKMIRAALHDTGHSPDKWCYASEATAETYNNIRHSAIGDQPHHKWYNIHTDIHNLRVWGRQVFPRARTPLKLDNHTLQGYFMGYASTHAIIKWCDPLKNKILDK